MRLTHSVTIGEDEYANIYAEVNTEPDDTHPILIKYADDEGGTAQVLSYEQFDVIADLVRAHRPDSAIKDAEIATVDRCVFGWETGVGHKTCALASGHETQPEWTHVSAEGWTYKGVPHRLPEF